MEKILIGKVVGAVALNGEVKVYSYSDEKDSFERRETVFLEDEKTKIENVRYKKNIVILKFTGIDDRNAAERLSGKGVYISEADLEELPQGTHYVRDLIGMKVVDHEGELLGTVSDVIKGSAQDLYEIEAESGKKILVPAVDEFILEIDAADRVIKVKLLEGLLEL